MIAEFGLTDRQAEAILNMRLAKLTGANVPMLLSRTGYSGNDACAVCHPSQTETWRKWSGSSMFRVR